MLGQPLLMRTPSIKVRNNRIIVTGSSGFIGMHLCIKLLENNFQVLGIDNMNNYYSLKLKKDRLRMLMEYKNFKFEKVNISNYKKLNLIFLSFKPHKVINLAAQAGVRYSITNPSAYISSNVDGFMNILECCRHYEVKGLIYASSSSVYGANKKTPFSIEDNVDKPISIYAATKRANELMAYSYSHLYNLNTTGLRFFTVYGPWGRPDMAMYIFTKKILSKKKIPVFNNGNMMRDFTYIDDIINGLIAAIERNYFCEIFNLGNNKTVRLLEMIKIIESNLNIKAKINYQDMQLGDVKKTYADINLSMNKLNYKPTTKIEDGVSKFVKWYKDYHNLY